MFAHAALSLIPTISTLVLQSFPMGAAERHYLPTNVNSNLELAPTVYSDSVCGVKSLLESAEIGPASVYITLCLACPNEPHCTFGGPTLSRLSTNKMLEDPKCFGEFDANPIRKQNILTLQSLASSRTAALCFGI